MEGCAALARSFMYSGNSALIIVKHGMFEVLDELLLLHVGHVVHGDAQVLHRCPATCISAIEQQCCVSKSVLTQNWHKQKLYLESSSLSIHWTKC